MLLIMDADYNREAFAQATGSLEKINLANDISPFEIYQIKDVMRDYISSPQYLPALYINEDGDLPFRDFALGWYKLIDILDFPVIFNDSKIKDINLADLDGVSFIIVHADKLSAIDIERLSVLNKPIVVLSAGKYQGAELPVNMSLIEDFIPGVGYYGKALPDIPNYEALEKLQAIFQEMKTLSVNDKYLQQNHLQADVWQDEEIVFSGEGPIIVNAAYFPNWRSENREEMVYQVTPGQMLVFAEGETVLKFSSRQGEKISGWLSFVSIIFLSILYILLRRRNR